MILKEMVSLALHAQLRKRTLFKPLLSSLVHVKESILKKLQLKNKLHMPTLQHLKNASNSALIAAHQVTVLVKHSNLKNQIRYVSLLQRQRESLVIHLQVLNASSSKHHLMIINSLC
jgi:hypothetical protein